MKRYKFIPFGDLEKVQTEDETEAFFKNPYIPWWIKLARSVRSGPRKTTRTPTWCKRCARKHSKQEPCEALRLERDLTAKSTKFDDHGEPIPNKRVGFYTTRPEES